jgi:hypothetical protein
METYYVFFEVGIEFLNIIYTSFMLKKFSAVIWQL